MHDPFHALIADAREFLNDLEANNSRDWFQGEKDRYDQKLKQPALRLLDQLSATFARMPDVPSVPKLFRPHRDVRFSKDQTPYHTHLHMLWSSGRVPGRGPCLFFGVSPTYVRFGGGIMAFEKTGLDDWRQAIDGNFGSELSALLVQLERLGFLPEEPELKRVPAPYQKDHAHADLLRRKGLTVWRDLPRSDWITPLSALTNMQKSLQPLLKRLQDHL
ncbi:DUF2461 domain-containing protein [Primorskyibacter sp. S87]|uniref:DUF2461 domain-containing protein n=1 Tax=Primorskyibacter sp. S87 TaxID=3415126 RepID=UPI003C7E0579